MEAVEAFVHKGRTEDGGDAWMDILNSHALNSYIKFNLIKCRLADW